MFRLALFFSFFFILFLLSVNTYTPTTLVPNRQSYDQGSIPGCFYGRGVALALSYHLLVDWHLSEFIGGNV